MECLDCEYVKETAKKVATRNLGGEKHAKRGTQGPSFRALLVPRISRGQFSFAVFFRVTRDGLSERGTTRSLLNVMIRFRNLICTATKLKLYNAFILRHFLYCSTIWHFCSTRNCDKLESLNKRSLPIVFKDKVSSCQQLLHKSEGATMYNRRIQNMLITIYKCLSYDSFPKYLKDMFTLRQSEYSFRERIFYHYVNLLLLFIVSTLFVTLHLRTETPYLML